MKSLVRSNVFSFLLGSFLFGSISLVSAYILFASDVSYAPSDDTWNVENVQDAVDELRDACVSGTTNDVWGLWLKNGGYNPLNYSSINILNNQQLMHELMNNAGAINYLSESSAFLMAGVLNSDIAKTELLNSSYVVTVPVMTSNTTPEGLAFANVEFSSGFAAWYAFDGNHSTDYAFSGTGYSNIGYKFTKPINVFRFELGQRVNGEGVYDATLYYSDDGVNYTKASKTFGLTTGTTATQTFDVATLGKHLYWRVDSNSGYRVNGGLSYLQFYGI